MDSDDWFTLAELTERLGALVWVEDQIAQVLHQWARVDQAPSAAVFFATAADHHRWHGSVVATCLPTSPRLGAEHAVRAPTSGWQRTVGTLQELTDPEATVTRVKALVRVIDPWLDRETNSLLDLARPVSDAPMMRWLQFVMQDHAHDGDAASLLLASQSSAAVSVDDHRLLAGLDLR